MLLILTLCSALSGSCQEHTLPLDTEFQLTPVFCTMHSQATIAEFMRAHPNERVTRVKCLPPGRRERSL